MKTIVIKIEHDDFEMVIGCNNLDATFRKAQRQQSQFLTAASYGVNEGNIAIYNPETSNIEPLRRRNSHPLIFENKEYFVDITFKYKQAIQSPYIYSRLKTVEDRFFYREVPGLLSGVINFVNDLGKSDLVLRYTKENEAKEIRFQFEVFPTKLNYRSDYTKIVTDIEQDYPYLVLDFLKKTYASFKTGQSPNTDLIWWQILGGLYSDFIRASKFILNKPHSRIVKQARHVTAEKISHWTASVEEAYAQHSHLPHKRYHTSYKTLSTDTTENRFFKFAIFQTLQRYKKVSAFIKKHYARSITQAFKDELEAVERQLQSILAHPFFNTIGNFQGLKQESLVLQKATGYSTLYQSWIMLNSGLRFLDGIQNIELKNIAELYQLWCFLEIKNMLQQLLGKARPDDIDLAPLDPRDNFVYSIQKGKDSRITFRLPAGEAVDLYHNFSYSNEEGQDLRSFTSIQKPDIVLNITKNDLKEQYQLTYLFDAKYRLASDAKEGQPDLPTVDAINQMHRYRDAIYYVNKHKDKAEKEVIGAYILFPGAGNIDAIQETDYYKAIAAVNIGAFPLRPNDTINKALLQAHLKTILGLDTESILNDIATQKDSEYQSPNPHVLIGLVPTSKHASCFEDSNDPFYYTGVNKPSQFGAGQLKYFAPYIKQKGIKEYYEITSYHIVPRNQIVNAPQDDPDDSSERLVIRLGRRVAIAQGAYVKINGPIGQAPYHYTDLKNIRNPQNNKINLIEVEALEKVKRKK